MKKLMIATLVMFVFSTGSFAQTTSPTVKPTPVKTKLVTKPVVTRPAVTTQTVKAPAAVKKDGTADMRFKANKATAAKTTAAGPVKKDGTKDMRYKENKKH